jgi:hypothetical protein
MAQERFPFLFIPGPSDTRGFTTTEGGGGSDQPRDIDPDRHAQFLRGRFDHAWQQATQRTTAVGHVTRQGVYLEFESAGDEELKAMSLEHRRGGVRLMNIRRAIVNGAEVTRATVYVPNDKRQYFLKKVEQYGDATSRRNTPLLANINEVRAAVLPSFWTSPTDLMPREIRAWVEVWLNTDDDDRIGEFRGTLGELNIQQQRAGWVLKFPERSVLIVYANADDLGSIIQNSDLIAEFRIMEEPIVPLLTAQPAEQAEWVAMLKARTRHETDTPVRICILDTGVNRGHGLLEAVLAEGDMETVEPDWGTHDHHKHGTLMAGVATYRNLKKALLDADPVFVRHRLESVKILPPIGSNPEDRWVAVTTQAVSRIEVERRSEQRIFCMAVTSPKLAQGEPSTWSAAVDAITSGYFGDSKRLFIISAGNLAPVDYPAYPASNRLRSVESPAQSWNALTVGACTDLTNIQAEVNRHFTPIAPAGGLSPYSTTSCLWDKNDWPVKPDIVMEGGNVGRQPNGAPVDVEDLAVLSLWHKPQERQFEHFSGTSSACAEAAWMAARIQAEYPDAWPETVRALMVHSARWTDAMRQQCTNDGTLDKRLLLRSCGYGVPDLDHALYCLRNEATLISQAELKPFKREEGRVKTNAMHLYRLPWPKLALEELDAAPVTLRITLSYFIEPGPDNVGFKDRYRYRSHGLKFRLINGIIEDEETFLKRISKQEREAGEGGTGTSEPGWTIGSQLRNAGSIHSDTWTGTARQLATMDRIAIHPTTGWWKERDHLGAYDKTARYSLVVSIETPPTELPIYNLVANSIPVPIRIDR